jgi:hypothetical protein
LTKKKKTRSAAPPAEPPRGGRADDRDEIDFPTVVWSLAILIVLVVIHRLVWGG